MIIDPTAQEDDIVLQKARIDVVSALAEAGFFDDCGDKHDFLLIIREIYR